MLFLALWPAAVMYYKLPSLNLSVNLWTLKLYSTMQKER